jgi:hypothetical protein
VAAPVAGSDTNVALLATATASSQDTADGETAAKAIDGVIGGYPATPTAEWSSNKGKAGSWIQLTWPKSYTLDHVVLFDRPNANDQVTSGTLLFSDGSTVAVGSLPNDGSAFTVSFTPRTVTSVRLTVNSVSTSTVNVGLSEFQAWGF